MTTISDGGNVMPRTVGPQDLPQRNEGLTYLDSANRQLKEAWEKNPGWSRFEIKLGGDVAARSFTIKELRRAGWFVAGDDDPRDFGASYEIIVERPPSASKVKAAEQGPIVPPSPYSSTRFDSASDTLAHLSADIRNHILSLEFDLRARPDSSAEHKARQHACLLVLEGIWSRHALWRSFSLSKP